jgi:hypothetical protein
MGLLNYMGAAPGPGLSMPAGIPGVGGPQDPTLSPGAAMAASAPPPPMMGGGGMPPMMGGGGGAPPPGMPSAGGLTDPAGRQYKAVTQADGSILLHLQNPDGTLGPAVKIIPAPKTPSAPAAAPSGM